MSISVIFKGLEGLNKFGKFLNSTLLDIFSVAEMGFTSYSNKGDFRIIFCYSPTMKIVTGGLTVWKRLEHGYALDKRYINTIILYSPFGMELNGRLPR